MVVVKGCVGKEEGVGELKVCQEELHAAGMDDLKLHVEENTSREAGVGKNEKENTSSKAGVGKHEDEELSKENPSSEAVIGKHEVTVGGEDHDREEAMGSQGEGHMSDEAMGSQGEDHKWDEAMAFQGGEEEDPSKENLSSKTGIGKH